MRKDLSKFLYFLLKNKQGVVTIEITLTVAFYFMIIFMIFEIGRLAITNAYWNYAVQNAVRETRLADLSKTGDYETKFRDNIRDAYKNMTKDGVMGLFASDIKPNDISIHVDCANSITALANVSKGNYGECKNMPLARYDLQFDYHFLIPLPFIPEFANHFFNQQVFVVQVNERPEFKDE